MSSLKEAFDYYYDHPYEFVCDAILDTKHTGKKPSNQQEEILRALEHGHKMIAGKSGHGIGKVMCNSIVISTPYGEKRWGNIETGDVVFGSNGKPTTVISTHKHKYWKFYKITFDDGSFTFAGLEHLWQVRGRKARRNGTNKWEVLSTEEIITRGVKRLNGITFTRQWEIPTVEPVEYKHKDVPINPYILGIWIGDGTRKCSYYHKPYPEIADKITNISGCKVTTTDGLRYRLHKYNERFKTLNVYQKNSPDRYIPDLYKYNSIDNRWELFCGLMDSDGEVHKSGSIGYSTTSKKLAEDVIWLARSLGFKAILQKTPKKGSYVRPDGKRVICKDCYRITINGTRNPFTVVHKKQKWKESEERYRSRWIDSIEYSHTGDGQCIEVDADDKLYASNDFILTHNTALEAWVVLWFMSTRPHCRIPCTAPTQPQLFDVLWSEIAKWHNHMPDKRLSSLFEWTQTHFTNRRAQETWFAVARSSSKGENMQGFHADELMFIIDEASGVNQEIMEVVQGALTNEGAYCIMFGNPTQLQGTFYDAFHKDRTFWKTFTFSCLESNNVSPEYIERMKKKYGEDSNIYKVRVLGEFPTEEEDTIIALPWAEASAQRTITLTDEQKREPIYIGCDVARFGNDKTIIVVRQGPKVISMKEYLRQSTMETTGYIMLEIKKYPHLDVIINVDDTGVGGGVTDRLNEMNVDERKVFINGINNGSRADLEGQFVNMGCELWWNMRDNIREWDIPNDEELIAQLSTRRFKMASNGKIQIERKDDMRKRDLDSPDKADALSLAFKEVKRSQTVIEW